MSFNSKTRFASLGVFCIFSSLSTPFRALHLPTRLLLGAGAGAASTLQDTSGASSSIHFGLNAEFAYAPFPSHFSTLFFLVSKSARFRLRFSSCFQLYVYDQYRLPFTLVFWPAPKCHRWSRKWGCGGSLNESGFAKNSGSFSYGLKASYDKYLALIEKI